MKFLLDMNLSPDWLDPFAAEGWDAVHWSTVGEAGLTGRLGEMTPTSVFFDLVFPF